MRQQAKEGKKESEQLTKKKGHERADRETEGGRRWDKSFQEHHRGLDVSCHLTCGNFTPHQVGREGTNMRRGVRRVAGQDWKTFFFFFWGAKADSSWEGGIVRVCMCIPATPAWLVSVSAYVTQNNRCHGSASVKGTGIFPSHSSLFFVLLVNVIQYHPPTTHTDTH